MCCCFRCLVSYGFVLCLSSIRMDRRGQRRDKFGSPDLQDLQDLQEEQVRFALGGAAGCQSMIRAFHIVFGLVWPASRRAGITATPLNALKNYVLLWFRMFLLCFVMLLLCSAKLCN